MCDCLLIIYCILHGKINECNSSIATIMCQGSSYRTVVVQLQNTRTLVLMTPFISQFCLFNKGIDRALNLKEVYLLRCKYNKTLTALPLCLYESSHTALGVNLMKNIALSFIYVTNFRKTDPYRTFGISRIINLKY